MTEQEKEETEDSGWKIGIGIVIVGILIIMSVGVFSAVKYGRGGCWAHVNVSLANMVYSDSKLKDQSTLDFSCDAGYIVSGPEQKKCEGGHWLPDDMVTCKSVS